jgi:hypothetical protein
VATPSQEDKAENSVSSRSQAGTFHNESSLNIQHQVMAAEWGFSPVPDTAATLSSAPSALLITASSLQPTTATFLFARVLLSCRI